MNHTIKSIIIVVAITSILVVGMNMIPLAQNTYASSHRHSEFKSQDNIANQGDDTYRSPGSQSSNVAIQESGKGNSATAYSDQSSNLQQQQNQPISSQQQDPQANKNFPITLNVLPDQRITNTNVNPNRNTASSNSSSASDASNDNTINNTALARQRQAEASCAVAVTCPEGSTTVTVGVTPPPADPCPHSPYTDFAAGPPAVCQNGEPTLICIPLTDQVIVRSGPDANGKCTATFESNDSANSLACEAAGGTFSNPGGVPTCTGYNADENCPDPEGSTQTPVVVNGRCTIAPGPT